MTVTSADRLQGVVSHCPQRDPEWVTVARESAPTRSARAGVAEPRRWLDMIGNALVASIAIVECRQDGPLGSSRAMPGRSDSD